jgi:hypothetical protein
MWCGGFAAGWHHAYSANLVDWLLSEWLNEWRRSWEDHLGKVSKNLVKSACCLFIAD